MKKNSILFFSCIILLVSCNNNHTPDNSPEVIKVKTRKALEKEMTFPVHASGRLASKAEFTLSFKTGGIIREVFAEEGDKVTKGQEIARLDLSEVTAHYRKALSAVEKAKRDRDRIKSLYKDSVATLEDLQNIKTQLDVARSNLDIAKFNLDHSKIHAPSDGVILRKLKEKNEMVASGQPVFLMGATGTVWVVNVNLTDRDIVKVNLHDSAAAYFDAYPEKAFPGYVSKTGKAADPYTGTYKVEITLNPAKVDLISGLIGNANIYPAKKEKKLTIPVDALIEASGNTGYVFEIIEQKPVKKKIQIDHMANGHMVISGLEKGAVVVTEGAKYIDTDSKIDIVE